MHHLTTPGNLVGKGGRGGRVWVEGPQHAQDLLPQMLKQSKHGHAAAAIADPRRTGMHLSAKLMC